jgi:hypothetical protein
MEGESQRLPKELHRDSSLRLPISLLSTQKTGNPRQAPQQSPIKSPKRMMKPRRSLTTRVPFHDFPILRHENLLPPRQTVVELQLRSSFCGTDPFRLLSCHDKCEFCELHLLSRLLSLLMTQLKRRCEAKATK